MKQILLMIAVMALVGCGKQEPAQPSATPPAFEEAKAKAEAGDAIAQFNLGAMYAEGQGVEQNNVTAYAWWNIAETNGDQNAKNGLSQLGKAMTPAQIAKAEKLVKEMVKKNPKLLK